MKWQGILSYSPSSKGPVIIEVGGWGGGGGWSRNWGAFNFFGWNMGGLKMPKDDPGGGGGALQVSFK